MQVPQTLFASLVISTLLACGADVVGVAVDDDAANAGDDVRHDGFRDGLTVSPLRAVGGQALTLTTPSLPNGCRAAGTCSVTIGGADAEVADDIGVVIAVVPGYQSVAGDVCLTLNGKTSCVAGFEMLDGPQVTNVEVRDFRCSASVLSIDGEGFPLDAVVTLDGVTLNWVGGGENIVAELPDDLVAGDKILVVSAPSHRRCGAPSEPFAVVIE